MDNAELVLAASILLGHSDPDAATVLESERKAPTTLGELALNGQDLFAIGFRGKHIGNMMEYLLDEVIRDPSLNERQLLLTIANKKRKEKEE